MGIHMLPVPWELKGSTYLDCIANAYDARKLGSGFTDFTKSEKPYSACHIGMFSKLGLGQL